MYQYANAQERGAIRDILAGLMRHSLIWPVAMPLAFAAMFGGLAALAGIPPVEFALDFLGDAAIALSGVTAKLWTVCFFVAAICFGVGRSLPMLLLHRSLNGSIVARFTQAVAIRGPHPAGVAALCTSSCRWGQILTRPSQTALSTASDLAGSTPRLE